MEKSEKTIDKEQIARRMRFSELVNIGKIAAPHGIRGAVRIIPYTDTAARFAAGSKLLLGKVPSAKGERAASEMIPLLEEEIARVQAAPGGRGLLVTFTAVQDRNAAEVLRSLLCYIPARTLPPPEEGSYYIRDLLKLAVIDMSTRERIGVIADVIQNGPQDIYVIDLEAADEPVLVPAVKEFVKKVDIEHGNVWIQFISGMLPQKTEQETRPAVACDGKPCCRKKQAHGKSGRGNR